MVLFAHQPPTLYCYTSDCCSVKSCNSKRTGLWGRGKVIWKKRKQKLFVPWLNYRVWVRKLERTRRPPGLVPVYMWLCSAFRNFKGEFIAGVSISWEWINSSTGPPGAAAKLTCPNPQRRKRCLFPCLPHLVLRTKNLHLKQYERINYNPNRSLIPLREM